MQLQEVYLWLQFLLDVPKGHCRLFRVWDQASLKIINGGIVSSLGRQMSHSRLVTSHHFERPLAPQPVGHLASRQSVTMGQRPARDTTTMTSQRVAPIHSGP